MIKVAFVFMSMPVGGAEDFAISMAERFPPDISARFVCLRSLGRLGESLAAAGRCELLPCATTKRYSAAGVARLGAWIREQGIQIVHSQTYHAHTYAVPAARKAGAAAVLHQQKTLERMPFHRYLTMWRETLRAAHVLALSEQTREDMARVFHLPAQKVSVIPNMVDRRSFFPRPAEEARAVLNLASGPLVGAVASLQAVKNHAASIRMLARVREGISGVRFALVGDGPLRAELEALAKESGVSGAMLFAGNQRPVAPWFQSFDVLVHPSRWEGQPLALLQALACRVPVVASRIEGNVHVLGADHPALFDLEDQEGYASLVRRLLSDQAFRTEVLEHQDRRPLPEAAAVAADLAQIYRTLLK